VTTWTLCTLSVIFLPSRFVVRFWKKGRLVLSEYFLIVALLSLFVGTGILQSTQD
jgi:hypothetical protein